MNKIKLYIVDDNEAICDALYFLLNLVYKDTLELKIFHHPVHFLQQYSPEWDGCLIVDMNIPSMNGLELVQKIKNNSSKLKILMMSGCAKESIINSQLNNEIDEFIEKPFKTDLFLEKITNLI
ncbi:MAG: response regulator [Legionella sp.]|uniref:response regulator n=1 Tax=Legionella sp. TaxID=459 RepID=UPI00283E1AC6|nr:response regulator [Legionella sp.]